MSDVKLASFVDSGSVQSFWTRQFLLPISSHQRMFDLIFGLAMPIICFKLDPIVFISDFGMNYDAFDIRAYKLTIYCMSAISICSLAAWLILWDKMNAISGFFAGIFMFGAAVALCIGIYILPLSIAGLIFIIGALGFIPFITAFVYLRNGVMVIRAGEHRGNRKAYAMFVVMFIMGAAFTLGSSYGFQWKVNAIIKTSVHDIVNGQRVESATRNLRFINKLTNLDSVVWAYSKESDPDKRLALKNAYNEATGKDIVIRLRRLED